ncbi:MAG: hypothetical protein F4139_14690, partial [Gemmatimonadetes bacterium]|nr:hypothetical protein [Gemmatimonadota bacterium]
MGKVRMGSVRLTAFATLVTGCADAPPPPSDAQIAYAEIVAEEDARGEIGLERVLAHLENDDPWVRAMAVRALGRLEDRGRVAELGERLDDPDPTVRMAAAAAMAQSVYGQDPGAVLPRLAERIGEEGDAEVVGSLATNLGRLAFGSVEQRVVGGSGLAAASERLEELGGDRESSARLGLARGIEAFARSGGTEFALPQEVEEIARSLLESGGEHPASVRTRRLAAAALTHANRLVTEDLGRLLEDADWGVRRQAMIAATRNGRAPAEAISAALADPDLRVRVEALRAQGRWAPPVEGCDAILAALDDSDPDVVATAMDLVTGPCREANAAGPAVAELSAVLDGQGADWRSRARALYALAGIAPGDAGDHIRRFAGDENPFVRAWVARAAGRA